MINLDQRQHDPPCPLVQLSQVGVSDLNLARDAGWWLLQLLLPGELLTRCDQHRRNRFDASRSRVERQPPHCPARPRVRYSAVFQNTCPLTCLPVCLCTAKRSSNLDNTLFCNESLEALRPRTARTHKTSKPRKSLGGRIAGAVCRNQMLVKCMFKGGGSVPGQRWVPSAPATPRPFTPVNPIKVAVRNTVRQ